MFSYISFQVINVILVLSITFLLKLLYDKMEIVVNRSLFLATFGVGIDLVSCFAISHIDSVDVAMAIYRVSIFGRMVFGMGFIGYMARRYKARVKWIVAVIWGISIIATFAHSFNIPVDPSHSFLTGAYMNQINGMMVLVGNRSFVYYFHSVVAIGLGLWGILLIFRVMFERESIFEGPEAINDFFFLLAITLEGTVSILYEMHYGHTVNDTAVLRALATAVYAILSLKYNLLDYNDVARQTILKAVGAGVIVLSDKYELQYANDIAYDIFPWIDDKEAFSETVKDAIHKKEFQLDKNGSTFKVTANRIMNNDRVEGYTILIVDISDIVKLENQAMLNEIARKNLLTNISHELRTPLNAITGASEMIEAEDNSREAYKNYAEVIRVATINLEDILNDILTASTEYSETLKPARVPYSICPLIDNVADMCIERVLNPLVKVSITLSEDIPVRAMGDDKRLMQLLMTILTNAIRYTDEGKISLDVTGSYLDDGRFKYVYTVKDTGRTVFKDDNDSVDHNTGFGISLIVARRLAEVLGGTLTVRTVPGQYNLYRIELPSELVEDRTIRSKELGKSMCVTVLGESDEGFSELFNPCHNLGIEITNCSAISLLRKRAEGELLPNFLFYDYERFGKRVSASEKAKAYIKVAILPKGKMPRTYDHDTIFVKKPISVISVLRAYLEYEEQIRAIASTEDSFVTPQARILVVDDNNMNLMVARNMIERYQAMVDICSSGYECMELLKSGKNYDLIFMDYMMEGMDGIETTKRIRKLTSPVRNAPILAYTANAVEGAKENYLAAGMNGVVYKPANSQAFENALREYLPARLLVFKSGNVLSAKEHSSEGFPDIEGVDKEQAVKYCGGNLDMYKEMLASFAEEIDDRESQILEYYEKGNYKNFTVSVHGVKGLARTLGITKLSSMMAEMEKAGISEDRAYIEANIQSLLSYYKTYKVILASFVEEKLEQSYKAPPADELEEKLRKMKDMIEDFEMDETEKIFNELWPGEYDAVKAPLMKGLKEAIEKVDYYSSKDYVELLLDTYK